MKHLVLLFALYLFSPVPSYSQEHSVTTFNSDPDLIQFSSEIKNDNKVFEIPEESLLQKQEINYFVIIPKNQKRINYAELVTSISNKLSLQFYEQRISTLLKKQSISSLIHTKELFALNSELRVVVKSGEL